MVTQCTLHWIVNKTEWKDTRTGWEVSSRNGRTSFAMTHVGQVPEQECYGD